MTDRLTIKVNYMNINKFIEPIKNRLHIHSAKTYKDGSTVFCDYIKKVHYVTSELKSECPYTNNKKHGICKEYYKSGQPLCEVSYKNDVKDGIEKIYYEKSGKLIREIPYKNGEKHGIEKWYYENGQLKEESRYVDGELIGTSNYDETGQLI